ncbi:MAG TPA: hypothetical protein VF846_14995 [Thermoanaerobaculia bacterium]|jgi:hypothetical protein
MRTRIQGTAAVFIVSGLLLQLAARWSPVLFSRISPPGGRTVETTLTTAEEPVGTAAKK